MSRYRLYGLCIESPLPLSSPRVARCARPDVRLREGRASRFARVRRELSIPDSKPDWFQCGHLPDGTTYLRWTGLFEFLVSADGRRIEYRRLAHASGESFNAYLLGQVLSFSLLAFGLEPLHGTAIIVDKHAIGFLGDCGYGKSTLGAAFLARSYPILTDDVMALERAKQVWRVHPGPPRLKLFPAVAERLLGSRAEGRLLNPWTSKLILGLDSTEAVRRPAPLKRLYVLSDPAGPRRRAAARVRITRLPERDAFLELMRSAFNVIRVDAARLASHFEQTTRLAHEVNVKRLSYPRGLSSIGEVCDAVLADLTR